MRIRLTIILVIISLTSCEKVIDLKTSSSFQGTVFIEGLLVVDQLPKIYLSEALPFKEAQVTPQQVFARNATITLTNIFGSETLQPDSIFDQFRCRWEPFYRGDLPVVFGQTYHMEVNFEGQIFTSSTTIDQSTPSIESITYTGEFFDIYGGHDGVKIQLQDPEGSPNNYRFQMNRRIDNTVSHAHELDVVQSDCTSGELFWVSDIGRTIFNDKGTDGLLLELLVEVSFEYSAGDSTWVTIQSLDAKAARFYKELDDQLISILNPFVEPVFLKSQIDGGAVGFFGSAVLTDSILFIYPQDNP